MSGQKEPGRLAKVADGSDPSHIAVMCGRYASYLPPDVLARLFRTVNALPNLQPTWNMAPTLGAPVVRRIREPGSATLMCSRWGLVPYLHQGFESRAEADG